MGRVVLAEPVEPRTSQGRSCPLDGLGRTGAGTLCLWVGLGWLCSSLWKLTMSPAEEGHALPWPSLLS